MKPSEAESVLGRGGYMKTIFELSAIHDEAMRNGNKARADAVWSLRKDIDVWKEQQVSLAKRIQAVKEWEG